MRHRSVTRDVLEEIASLETDRMLAFAQRHKHDPIPVGADGPVCFGRADWKIVSVNPAGVAGNYS